MSKEKEVEDALIVLYKCSLKDKEYTTQKEQYKIVREYILQQQKEIEELKFKNRTRILGKYGEVSLEELIKDKFISKDKIREKIKELQEKPCYAEDVESVLEEIETLKQLLEE